MLTLRIIASSRLTAACLIAALLLVVLGTLRQQDIGLLGIQYEYFHAFFVIWDLPKLGISVAYLPGGYLIGAILILNLVASSAKQVIIQRIHPGLLLMNLGAILMAISEFATSAGREEGYLALAPGQQVAFAENWRAAELAIFDRNHSEENDLVVTVPDLHLRRLQTTLVSELPFTVSVNRYFPHSEIKIQQGIPPAEALSSNNGFGVDRYAIPKATNGRLSERRQPAAELTVFANSDDKVIGTWLVAVGFPPQLFTYDNRQYAIQLRPERHQLPFAARLVSEIDTNTLLLSIEDLNSGEATERALQRGHPFSSGDWSLHMAEPVEHGGAKTLLAAKTPARFLPYLGGLLLMAGFIFQASYHLAVRYLKRTPAA